MKFLWLERRQKLDNIDVRPSRPNINIVICRKRRAFEMQFHLIVVSVFLKTHVKDHGDSSSRLLERRI